MKRLICISCLIFFIAFSCKDYVTNIVTDETSKYSNEIDSLKEVINSLQSVISLQHAYIIQKTIVAIESDSIDTIDCWRIAFSDNTAIQLPQSIVGKLSLNDETQMYTIELADGQVFVFNVKEIVYPTGIVLLTQQMSYMSNTEVMFEFRVNPSNANFSYDVAAGICDIMIDRIGEVKTYSFEVNSPENYHISKIEPSTDENGHVKQGQYRAYIQDHGRTSGYKDAIVLALTTKNLKGETIQLSSSTMYLERKKFTSLPVVVIRTENEKEILDKTTWISATMKIDGIGKFTQYEGAIGIRGRGNSTWNYPKKPYAIKLEQKESLLGMPAHKRWVLLANYIDRTLIRNHISFEIARRTELAWTPNGQFVEVMLNDVHLGNYYLCEQIKTDENRVNIKEMDSYDLDEETITGGYLLEFDSNFDEINRFRSEIKEFPVMVQEPAADVLQPEQLDYIRDYVNTIERMLYENEDFASGRDYISMIDEQSFIDWWFVMELTGIQEAAVPRSCWFYKDRNSPLKAGPVWDFDYYSFVLTNGFIVKETLWYDKLFTDPEFVMQVKSRWDLLKSGFEEIIPLFEEWGNRIAASEELNSKMWDLRNKTVFNGDENLSHREAYILMRKNYENRLRWLDTSIQNL